MLDEVAADQADAAQLSPQYVVAAHGTGGRCTPSPTRRTRRSGYAGYSGEDAWGNVKAEGKETQVIPAAATPRTDARAPCTHAGVRSCACRAGGKGLGGERRRAPARCRRARRPWRGFGRSLVRGLRARVRPAGP